MKRTAAILIAVAAVLATLAIVSLDRTEAATSPGKGLNVSDRGIPATYRQRRNRYVCVGAGLDFCCA